MNYIFIKIKFNQYPYIFCFPLKSKLRLGGRFLRVLGKPSHISSQNHIIVRTSSPPGIGSRVVNESNSLIGKVIDVFGPVDKPFISIKPSSSVDPYKILEQTLFVKEEVLKKKYAKKRRI